MGQVLQPPALPEAEFETPSIDPEKGYYNVSLGSYVLGPISTLDESKRISDILTIKQAVDSGQDPAQYKHKFHHPFEQYHTTPETLAEIKTVALASLVNDLQMRSCDKKNVKAQTHTQAPNSSAGNTKPRPTRSQDLHAATNSVGRTITPPSTLAEHPAVPSPCSAATTSSRGPTPRPHDPPRCARKRAAPVEIIRPSTTPNSPKNDTLPLNQRQKASGLFRAQPFTDFPQKNVNVQLRDPQAAIEAEKNVEICREEQQISAERVLANLKSEEMMDLSAVVVVGNKKTGVIGDAEDAGQGMDNNCGASLEVDAKMRPEKAKNYKERKLVHGFLIPLKDVPFKGVINSNTSNSSCWSAQLRLPSSCRDPSDPLLLTSPTNRKPPTQFSIECPDPLAAALVWDLGMIWRAHRRGVDPPLDSSLNFSRARLETHPVTSAVLDSLLGDECAHVDSMLSTLKKVGQERNLSEVLDGKLRKEVIKAYAALYAANAEKKGDIVDASDTSDIIMIIDGDDSQPQSLQTLPPQVEPGQLGAPPPKERGPRLPGANIKERFRSGRGGLIDLPARNLNTNIHSQRVNNGRRRKFESAFSGIGNIPEEADPLDPGNAPLPDFLPESKGQMNRIHFKKRGMEYRDGGADVSKQGTDKQDNSNASWMRRGRGLLQPDKVQTEGATNSIADKITAGEYQAPVDVTIRHTAAADKVSPTTDTVGEQVPRSNNNVNAKIQNARASSVHTLPRHISLEPSMATTTATRATDSDAPTWSSLRTISKQEVALFVEQFQNGTDLKQWQRDTFRELMANGNGKVVAEYVKAALKVLKK